MLGMELPVRNRLRVHVRVILQAHQRSAIQHQVDGDARPDRLHVLTSAVQRLKQADRQPCQGFAPTDSGMR